MTGSGTPSVTRRCSTSRKFSWMADALTTSFSEPVTLSDNAVSLTCTQSGDVSADVSPSGSSAFLVDQVDGVRALGEAVAAAPPAAASKILEPYLGGAFEDDTREAWTAAYTTLSAEMIGAMGDRRARAA